MQVTDDERREVAERLRSFVTDNSVYADVDACHVLYSIGLYYKDIDRIYFSGIDVARLADLIEPNRGSGGRIILCAHCENVSWCGCEPGDEEGGCDFEPSVTDGEPPYNLYSLYEAVLRRRPRDEYAIEDDEVDELVDALLDICNAPGHECIQRKQPSEPKVRCVAEVKVDEERLEKLAHDAAVELTGIDRDALLELADELDGLGLTGFSSGWSSCAVNVGSFARRIRKALGVES